MAVDYAAGFLTDTGTLKAPTADGTAGQVIQTDGSGQLSFVDVGTAWGEITGTLANQTDLQSALDAKLSSYGIGSAVTSGTEGSVLFVASGGTLTQDNDKLFFNNTLNHLGVGRQPGCTLDLLGDTTVGLSGRPYARWGDSNFAGKDFSGVGFVPTYGTTQVGVVGIASGSGGLLFNGWTNSGSVRGVAFQSNQGATSTTSAGVSFDTYKWDGTTGRVALANSELVCQFLNGNTPLVTILGSGNVGFGKTNPNTAVDSAGPVTVGVYTFAAVPSASANSGAIIRISDRAQKQAYSDGTNWRFTGTDAIIS